MNADGTYEDQGELDAAKQTMSPESYEQEFECSFQAGVTGSYYGGVMEELEKKERIKNFEIDLDLPVETWWDLGMNDSTVITFVQRRKDEVRVIDCYENSSEGLEHYANVLDEKPYTYDKHIAPHDIRVREIGTNKSRWETAKELGIEDGDTKKLNENIKDSLLQEVDKRLKINIKQQVFKSLTDSHEVDLPKSLVEIEIRQMAEVTLKNLEREGADMKDIKLEPSMFEERAKVSCKLRLLLGNIVEVNSLESTEEQTQNKIQEFALNYDKPDEAINWFNDDPKRLEEPKALATEDNVVAWFINQCKKEKKVIFFI